MKIHQKDLWIKWLVSISIGLAVAWASYTAGVHGDCTPHEVDGQCGLSSFVGLVDGVIAGMVIVIAMTIYLLIVAHRRRLALNSSADN
jgi:hypothetical protein